MKNHEKGLLIALKKNVSTFSYHYRKIFFKDYLHLIIYEINKRLLQIRKWWVLTESSTQMNLKFE